MRRKLGNVPVSVLLAALAVAALIGSPPAAGKPLTLRQCLSMALENDERMRLARADVEAAETARTVSLLQFTPEVSGSVTGFASDQPVMPLASPDPGIGLGWIAPPSASSGRRGTVETLQFSQWIFDGGRAITRSQLDRLGLDVAREKAELTRTAVLADIETRYWRIVEMAERLRILRDGEGRLEALARQPADKRDAGASPRTDELRLSLQRRKLAVDVEALEAALALSERQLRHGIGLDADGALELAEVPRPPEDPNQLRDARTGAIDRRPETALFERAARAEELNSRLRFADLLPTVSVGGAMVRMDLQGLDGSTSFAGYAVLRIPISNWWTRAPEYEAHRTRESLARGHLKEARDVLRLQVEEAWNQLVSAWKAATLAADALALAELDLADASDRSIAGSIRLADLLDSHQRHRQAREDLVQARVDYWLKRSAYLRATGQRWEPSNR